MSFNPDPSKQSQKITFSRNVNMDSHTPSSSPALTFNDSIIYQSMSQRHLGIILDNRLSRPVCSKISRTVGVCYANFNVSSQDLHFLLCRKHLSNLILIMATLYMKKLIIYLFNRK